MVYRNKGQFILDIDCLQEIVKYILRLPNNEDVRIEITKSPKKHSKSLYLKIIIDDYSTILRISDHDCKGEVRQIIVRESTGIANVCYKIESAIKDLRIKKVRSLLDRGL